MLTKFLKQILDIFKKDFVYLGLDKKKIKKSRISFNRFIKMVNFIIKFFYSFFNIHIIYQAQYPKSLI